MANVNYQNLGSLNPYDKPPQNFIQGWMFPQQMRNYDRSFNNQMALSDIEVARKNIEQNEFASTEATSNRMLAEKDRGLEIADRMALRPHQQEEAVTESQSNTQGFRNQLTKQLFEASTMDKNLNAQDFHSNMLRAIPMLRSYVDFKKQSNAPADFTRPTDVMEAIEILKAQGVPTKNFLDESGQPTPRAGQLIASMAFADDKLYQAMVDHSMQEARLASSERENQVRATAPRNMSRAELDEKLLNEATKIRAKKLNATDEEKGRLAVIEDYFKSQSAQFMFRGALPGQEVSSVRDALRRPEEQNPKAAESGSSQIGLPANMQQPPPGTHYTDSDGKVDENREIVGRVPNDKGDGWRIIIRNKATGQFEDIYTDKDGNEK